MSNAYVSGLFDERGGVLQPASGALPVVSSDIHGTFSAGAERDPLDEFLDRVEYEFVVASVADDLDVTAVLSEALGMDGSRHRRLADDVRSGRVPPQPVLPL